MHDIGSHVGWTGVRGAYTPMAVDHRRHHYDSIDYDSIDYDSIDPVLTVEINRACIRVHRIHFEI